MRLPTRLAHFRDWLLAPPRGKRAPAAPLKYRKPCTMRYVEGLRYESSVTTAASLFDRSDRTWDTWLIIHIWHLKWRGQTFEIKQKDQPPKFTFRKDQVHPCWVCPSDLSTVWFLQSAHECTLLQPDAKGRES